jgi:hypothetical protein
MTHPLRAAALAAALVVGTTALPAPASADSFVRTAVPVVLWAATGAVIGAVVWPALFPAAVSATSAAAGATAAAAQPIVWSWESFQTTRAAVGAGVGALLGYSIAP